jgi:hypothetical protein
MVHVKQVLDLITMHNIIVILSLPANTVRSEQRLHI